MSRTYSPGCRVCGSDRVTALGRAQAALGSSASPGTIGFTQHRVLLLTLCDVAQRAALLVRWGQWRRRGGAEVAVLRVLAWSVRMFALTGLQRSGCLEKALHVKRMR